MGFTYYLWVSKGYFPDFLSFVELTQKKAENEYRTQKVK